MPEFRLTLIRALIREANYSLLKQYFLKSTQILRLIYSRKREIYYLESFSPKVVQNKLMAMGLNGDCDTCHNLVTAFGTTTPGQRRQAATPE